MSGCVETIAVHGLECLRLRAEGASVVVARLGGQVISWIPADGRERLFLSERACFNGSVALRGGIPVCFPQFSGLGSLPKHGLVRTRHWQVVRATEADGGCLRLSCGADPQSRALWTHEFELVLDVHLSAAQLSVGLTVRNPGAADFSFTGALHTYFAVGDIGAVRLLGLTGVGYRDAAGGNALCTDTANALVFGPEIDRVYHDAPRELMLIDGTARLSVASGGFADTVVWNPGAVLCAGLADMAPDGYRRMVCVEAASARLPVCVPAGADWRGHQMLTALPPSGN